MADKKDIDDVTGTETTGHAWDGIKELNTPLPRWWLNIFYLTCAWALVYWVLMPAWPVPGGNTPGIRNHSDRANVAADIAELQAARADRAGQILNVSVEAIERDPQLFQFAMAMGESVFGDNCATCHGAGGRGNVGYPRLADDVWLWGGKLEDIQYTIRHGIRNEDDPDARFSMMPAYGRDGLLTRDEIADVAHHVMSLSGQAFDAAAATRGAVTYDAQCSSCHGVAGLGDQLQGAPNLTDAEWLYGGEYETVVETIHRGPYGVMPPWDERLDDATIAAVALYVHNLGGGER